MLQPDDEEVRDRSSSHGNNAANPYHAAPSATDLIVPQEVLLRRSDDFASPLRKCLLIFAASGMGELALEDAMTVYGRPINLAATAVAFGFIALIIVGAV